MSQHLPYETVGGKHVDLCGGGGVVMPSNIDGPGGLCGEEWCMFLVWDKGIYS